MLWFLQHLRYTGPHNYSIYLSLLRPGRGAEYCDQFVRLCVCLCVCLSVSTNISLEPLDRSSRNFLCRSPTTTSGVAIPGRSLMSMNALFLACSSSCPFASDLWLRHSFDFGLAVEVPVEFTVINTATNPA